MVSGIPVPLMHVPVILLCLAYGAFFLFSLISFYVCKF